MSLWNNIKDWFDKEEPQQKPKQPAWEGAQVIEEQIVAEMFTEMLIEAGSHQDQIRKTQIIKLFVDWYDGDNTRQCIAECFQKFVSEHPQVQKKFSNRVLK